ncbi:hypothetical protein [Natranaerofaba carboxydovora]|nr:hypothetical protein [Natranaerofaba carboxydovora]
MIFYNRGIHEIQNRKMDYITFGDRDGWRSMGMVLLMTKNMNLMIKF